MARRVTFKAGIEGAEREITVEVADGDADPWGLDAKTRWVGTDVPRVDGAEKATGRARYAWDQNRPRMAYAGFLGSPYAHAEVVAIEATAARALPGVLSVKTFEGRRVTHAGQIVAAVCAESESILSDALRALRVEWRPLPHAITVEAAERPDAPAVDPARPNAGPPDERASRDPAGADDALKSAPVRVEAEFRTAIQTHSALETHGVVVDPNGPDGTALVWASTQATGSIAGGIAGALGVPPGRVRVLAEHVGGGFGAKFGVRRWDQITAQFARETGRPVKGMLPRRLEHLLGGNRPDSIQRVALAGRRDGTILALVGETRGTGGNGPGGAGVALPKVYAIPKVRMAQRTVSTFTESGQAFRAPGHPQGLFAMEGILERFAAEIGMDSLEVRLKNDPHPVRQVQWRLGAERIGWKEKRGRRGRGTGHLRRGVGCGAAIWYQRGSTGWTVDLSITRDGVVTVMNGAQDIGTGTRTVLAVLAAEELGVDPRTVVVRLGDSTLPAGPGSGGSQTAPGLGPAARNAGLDARRQLEALLALEWGVDAGEVSMREGAFRGPRGKKASFAEACSLIGPEGLRARGVRAENYAGYSGDTAGCQFAEVVVDIETGVVGVERVVAVHDAGRIVDTLTARSQVIGGVIQGVSFALFEERRLDAAQGDMTNPTFDTYRIAGMKDCPEIDVLLTSVASGFNNVGMMGLGEPATVPTAAAIANAVFDATGVPMTELPMTPARVLAALERSRR